MSFLKGVVTGAALAGVVFWKAMPQFMLTIHKSRFSVDETVARLEASAKGNGWNVPKIYNIQETLRNAGFQDMRKIQILSMCQPKHAYQILTNDRDKKVAAIMPCRVGVYEDAHGDVYVASMNIGLMSKLFGGNIAKVMGAAAKEERTIVGSVL